MIFVTVQAAHVSRNVAHRRVAQAHAVGTHISDMPVLVKLLRDLHRSANAVTQFSRCLLLQGRRRKRRGRSPFAGFHPNIGYFVIGSDTSVQELFRILDAVLLLSFSFEGNGLPVISGEIKIASILK